MKAITYIVLLVCFYFRVFSTNFEKIQQHSNLFNTNVFIENNGQYNGINQIDSHIEYAVDHFATKIYFTKNSVIYKYDFLVNENEEEEENELEHPDKLKKKLSHFQPKETTYSKFIRVTWLNTNKDFKIVSKDKTSNYYSYGDEASKAYGYQSICYKNIYDGIDIEYTIDEHKGLKYTIYVKPYADISKIKYHYTGDFKSIHFKDDQINIQIEDVVFNEKAPISFYEDKTPINSTFKINRNKVGFTFPRGYDPSKLLIIDPYILPISTLSGSILSSNKGFDVDYDYDGNLFVYGGGAFRPLSPQKLAKYSSSGVLLWTFMGSISTPIIWDDNPSGFEGNFLVEKNLSQIYITQGFNNPGFESIRLNTLGFFDRWHNIPSLLMNEGWELAYECNTNRILVTGGGTAGEYNIASMDTSTGAMNLYAFTGIINGGQDIVNSIFDNDGNLFLIMASAGTPMVNNRIYKISPSYSSFLWSTPSSYLDFVELQNKPYYNLLGVGHQNSNGFNALAVNTHYLFYYDGIHLKAFNKTTGVPVGIPVNIIGHTSKMQGGIAVDECNNVYVGGNNGNIKVYSFDGALFNNQPDIILSGYDSASIYDIKYNTKEDLLFISGDSIVAKVAPSIFCSDTLINISSGKICSDGAYVFINSIDSTADYDIIWTDTTTGIELRGLHHILTESDTIYGLISGRYYRVSVTKYNNCSINKKSHFILANISTYDIDTMLCFGDSLIINNHIYTTSGNYIDTIRIGLCDSIINTSLILSNYITTHQTIHICLGNSYVINGHLYDSNGIYLDTFNRIGNCDSIVITTLILQPHIFTYNRLMCTTDSIRIGLHTYTDAGIYFDTLRRTGRCDSIIITNLVTYEDEVWTNLFEICRGDTIRISSLIFTRPGTYFDTIRVPDVCDSILTTYISWRIMEEVTQDFFICPGDSVIVNGHIYKDDGGYYDTFHRSGNCDTFFITNVRVGVSDTTNLVFNACLLDTILYNGNRFTHDTLVIERFSRIEYCDSFHIYSVHFSPNPTKIENYQICNGETIRIRGHDYSTLGTFYDTLLTSLPCDTIFQYTISNRASITYYKSLFGCSGDTFNIGIHHYYLSGIYRDSFSRLGTCDSILETTIIIYNDSIIRKAYTFCIGDSIKIGTHTYTTSGLFIDTFISFYGCDSIHYSTITVRNNPIFSVSNDTSICTGSNITLQAMSTSSYNYLWSNGDINSTLTTTPISTTTYFVTATDSFGCKSNDSIIIIVLPLPVLELNDTSICPGQSALLKVSGANTYLWNTSDTSNTILVTPIVSTLYSVTGTDLFACKNSKTVLVKINSLTVNIEAIPDTIINQGENVLLHALYSFLDSSILWDPNYALSQIDSSYTLANPTTNTTYSVLIKDSNGCVGIDYITIIVIPADKILVPTGFSPNGDGINDQFQIVLASHLELEHFSIYNRWGEEVFNYPKDNNGKAWDGTYKGREQSTGVFTWYIQVKNKINQDKIIRDGNISLIR